MFMYLEYNLKLFTNEFFSFLFRYINSFFALVTIFVFQDIQYHVKKTMETIKCPLLKPRDSRLF